jgi:phospholipid/cholesterol/gamma-HCH transport system substrate-binding protein
VVPPRVLAVAGLVAGVIVIAILIGQPFSSSGGHYVRAEFSSVEQLVPGLEVRIAGRKVGAIDSISLVGHQPIARLGVTEQDVWPLPAGTTAQIHWGSTTSLAYRFVELLPGPLSGARLANDAMLPQLQTVTPVELDQAYRIFRGRTTGDVKALAGELAGSLATNGSALQSGLAGAPGGLNATSALLSQLGADPGALNTLVAQGDRVTSALAGRQGDLGALIQHLAGTFDEFANHTSDEQASLDQAPQALSTATTTLGRLDTSLSGLQGLVNDIAPGAVQLRRLAPTARDALRELQAVAPLATSTLDRGTNAAPSLTKLLDTGTPFLPRLSSTLGQSAPIFACLRPYTPELAGMLGTWTGWNDNYDSSGHYARTFPAALNPTIVPGTPLTSAQAVASFKGALFYAMPRPPGLNAGTPWLQPQCGAGAQSLDASQDPEAGTQ